MIDIAGQLRFLLQKNGWGLGDLSSQTNLSVSYLSDIQRGKTNATLPTLENIAGAFQMTLVEFLGGANLELSNDEKWLLDAYRAGDTIEILRLLVHNADGIRQPEPIVDESGEITEIPF